MFSHDKLEPQENLYYYYYDTLTSNEFFWASVCALVYYALILMFGLRKTSTILIDDGKNYYSSMNKSMYLFLLTLHVYSMLSSIDLMIDTTCKWGTI